MTAVFTWLLAILKRKVPVCIYSFSWKTWSTVSEDSLGTSSNLSSSNLAMIVWESDNEGGGDNSAMVYEMKEKLKSTGKASRLTGKALLHCTCAVYISSRNTPYFPLQWMTLPRLVCLIPLLYYCSKKRMNLFQQDGKYMAISQRSTCLWSCAHDIMNMLVWHTDALGYKLV